MILFTPKAWTLLRAVLRLAKSEMNEWEVHGYGRIEALSPSLALVDDIAMPEQVASSAFIETDAEQYAAWQRDHFKLSGKMTDKQIEAANAEQDMWRFWWHSHGSMGASYSSTDWKQLKEFAEAYGVFFGAVFNTDMSNTAYMAYCQSAPDDELRQVLELPTSYPVALEWGSCDISLPTDTAIQEQAEAMFKEKVVKKVYTPSTFVSYPAGVGGKRRIWAKRNDGTWGYCDDDSKEAGSKSDRPLAGENGNWKGSVSAKSFSGNAPPDGDDPDDADPEEEETYGYAQRGCLTCMGLLQRWEVATTVDGQQAFTVEFVCDDCDTEESLCSCLAAGLMELEMGGHI